MLFDQRPDDFSPQYEIAKAYIEHDGCFLFVKRHPSKREGMRWGAVAGKIEQDEDVANALVREVFEETGIRLNRTELPDPVKTSVCYLDHDVARHVFHVVLSERPTVTLKADEYT